MGGPVSPQYLSVLPRVKSEARLLRALRPTQPAGAGGASAALIRKTGTLSVARVATEMMTKGEVHDSAWKSLHSLCRKT